MKNFKRTVSNFKDNVRNGLKKIKIKIYKTKTRINKIKVNTFLGYGSIILIGGLFISINICNFLVCLSIKYPELNISINNSGNIASIEYAKTPIPENTEFNSALEKKLDIDKNKKNFINNTTKKTKVKEINKTPVVKAIIVKPIVKPIIEPEIKEIVITPVVKAIIVKPIVKPIIEPEIKEIVITPVMEEIVEPLEVNNIDPIYLSVNNEINRLLDKLNIDIFRGFKLKTIKNNNIFLENGVRYTYVYKNYKNFGKGFIPNENDLKRGGLDKNTTLLLLDENIGASFVVDYKKVKLISDYIILGITNKKEFLNELADDKKSLNSDTDNLFLSLKSETFNVTKGLSDAGKIYKIYDYILKNISYSTNFSLDNKEIFSGIDTYKNKNGICGGYSKLNIYMLSFAGISNAKVIRGDVLDAPDFPNIGHAWIQIGSLYYDPTFDDPVGTTKTKNYDEYKYFGLPKDLFYTNKYDYGSLPSYIKTETLESRENIIRDNISKLATKYESKNYILLKPFVFRMNNGLTFNEKITIEKLKNIIPYHEVNNYQYIEDDQLKKISNIDYYTTNDLNLEILLEQVNYNIDGFKLFKWDDGTYRLSYNVNIG